MISVTCAISVPMMRSLLPLPIAGPFTQWIGDLELAAHRFHFGVRLIPIDRSFVETARWKRRVPRDFQRRMVVGKTKRFEIHLPFFDSFCRWRVG
jgi:hypothetical protein